MRLRTRWLVVLGLIGLSFVGWLVWAWGRTEPPSWPVLLADGIAVVGLGVFPWLVLTARRIGDDPAARGALGRVVINVAFVGCLGVGLGLLFMLIFRDQPHLSAGVQGFSILLAGLLLLLGGVLLPWFSVLTRAVLRERASRVRAEERAAMAAHLHDTVLQTLTLIQKRTDEPDVLRLARASERQLREWLYGTPRGDDFAGAVRAAVAEIEDRYAVAVDLVTVGSRPLDAPANAVVGAVREALTNAARHAGVRRVSVFAEADHASVAAVIRDRGCGIDPMQHREDGRGIADSIEGRIRQQGGQTVIRSAVGEGTEVEVRVPVAQP